MIKRLAVLFALVLASTGVSALAAPAAQASSEVTFYPTTYFYPGDAHHSARATLQMQHDGNFVLYKDGWAVWSSGTAGAGDSAWAAFQWDGNLVVYVGDHYPLWSSQTNGNYGARMVLTDDGNLIIFRSNNSIAWQTGTGDPPPPDDPPCVIYPCGP